MRRLFPLLLASLLAGCASRPTPVALVAPPPVPAPAPGPTPAALPPGATPGMVIPAVLTDGSYPTPNQRLTPAAALWHLRAGLNVAALACRGEEGLRIVAGYNALLARYKAPLAAAEASYAAEFRAGGGDWRDRYDDAMTRLYNFFSQTPARTALCAAADRTLAAAAALPAEGLPAFAGTQIAALDQPFTDFYRAYDAWRTGTPATAPLPPTVIAVAAVPPLPAPAPAPQLPRLVVDPSVFAEP